MPVAADLGPLTPAAAAHLGLTPAARVAAGLVDAHAGALAVLGRFASDPDRMARNVALIAGTSTCLMRLAPGGAPRPGVWGPYPDGVLPGFSMTEGGQSASGALLDHVLRGPGGTEPDAALHARVAARIAELRRRRPRPRPLDPRAARLPRQPLAQADARARGMILGLDLDGGFDGLCRLYYRTAVGLALGLRETLDALTADGPAPEALHAAGGHARNPLLMALYADAAGVPVHEPLAPDPVLLGTAMTAAVTAGLYPSLAAAAEAMGQGATIRRPDPSAAGRMARDTPVLKAMRALQRPVNTG